MDIHSGYRMGRMHHEPPDELASSEITFRILRPHIFRFVVFLVVENVLGALAFVFWLLALISSGGSMLIGGLSGQSPGGSGSGSGFFGGLASITFFLMLAVAVAWLVSLFLPMREPIAEYGVLLEGRAAAAVDAFGWITRTAQMRNSPVQTGDASSGAQSLLTLRTGMEQAAVLVTTYGSDLYLGWTMWRRRSTVQVIVHSFRDMIDTLRGGTYSNDVRLGSTRAFRELVHSLTREGVQVAILGSAAAGGHGVP